MLAGNSYLAAYASEHAKWVEVMPSCVDAGAHEVRSHTDVEVLTVGWMGSASTTPYLLAVLPILRSINRRGPRLRLLAVGAGPLPREDWIEQRAWTLETEASS